MKKFAFKMHNWITSLFSTSNQKGTNDKYGLQMSLTLSTHPFLEKYREDIRADNQEEPYFKKYYSEYLKYKCNIPKGRQDFPTIIVKGNQSSDIIYMMLPINIMKYLNDNLFKLKDALLDESYYGQSIYIKNSKHKEIDPSLFKPFQFESEATITVIESPVLFWNVPLIFIGFRDVNKDGIYDSFIDILNSNPIGKNITSIEFLEYMSQPVVFWVKSVGEKKQTGKDGEQNEGGAQKYDKLEYKEMSNFITSDLLMLMRDSYLESIGRKLLDPNKVGKENYLEPKRLHSIH